MEKGKQPLYRCRDKWKNNVKNLFLEAEVVRDELGSTLSGQHTVNTFSGQ